MQSIILIKLKAMNLRYYQIGGITIQVDSDLPFQESTFLPKFAPFRVTEPGADLVTLHHHFSLPDLDGMDLGSIIHREPPWIINRNSSHFIYRMTRSEDDTPSMVALFSPDYRNGHIYAKNAENFLRGNHHSLTLFPTDQILLIPLIAKRKGFLIHAAGMVIHDQGLLFVGHSDAGKSTTVTMLRKLGDILCDDRIIVRSYPEESRIYGTWSHGTVPDVSAGSAPLRAIMILEKSPDNHLLPLTEKGEILRILPQYVIRSLIDPKWWMETIDVLGDLIRRVPVYRLQLDKSGGVADVIEDFLE